MNAQDEIKAEKTALFLMLLVTCVAALVAGNLTAKAQAATAHTAASLRLAPIEDSGTPPTILRDTIVRLRRVSVNTSGVAAKSKTFAQVDETGHTVNAKGFRVGGMYEGS